MLTRNGLEIKRLPEIIEETVKKQQEDISPDIGVDDNDLIYQITTIFSFLSSNLWELIAAVNDNFNVDKAEGRNLDDLGALVGIVRIPASYTNGNQEFTGAPNTTIPSYAIFEEPLTRNRFRMAEDVAITTETARKVWISVNEVQETSYTIGINGRNYTYSAQAGDTEIVILTQLESQISADVGKEVEAVIEGTQLYIQTLGGEFSIANTANFTLDSITVQGRIEALEPGNIPAPPNSITRVITPIQGLESITNPEQLSIGRFRETDEEYRSRIKSEQTVSGAATLPAIIANLRNVPGVSYVTASENTTMHEDIEGRPPKSIEAVIQGGEDEVIAKTLWDVKGGGIETYGTITVAIIDDENQTQEVKFSRPTQKNIAIRITYSLYDEEVFPVGGEDLMRTTVRDYTNNLGLGKDVIPGRYFGSLYSTVSGIESLVVEIQEVESPGAIPNPDAWQTTSLSVTDREFPATTLADVSVVLSG